MWFTAKLFGSSPESTKCIGYFADAIRHFYKPRELTELLKQVGFVEIENRSFLTGVLSYHISRNRRARSRSGNQLRARRRDPDVHPFDARVSGRVELAPDAGPRGRRSRPELRSRPRWPEAGMKTYGAGGFWPGEARGRSALQWRRQLSMTIRAFKSEMRRPPQKRRLRVNRKNRRLQMSRKPPGRAPGFRAGRVVKRVRPASRREAIAAKSIWTK